MSGRARLGLFSVSVAGLAAVLVLGLRGLPRFGGYHGVYGRVISGVGVSARHGTDLVTALNFDFRAFDTLGEEFILFASVLGIIVVVREVRGGERVERGVRTEEDHQLGGASEATRALSLLLVPALIAFAVYIVIHGQLTPGGGFQGGVILAAAPLAAFVAGWHVSTRRVPLDRLIELAEAIGAGGYALLGVSGLVLSGIFLENPVPLGTTGHLLSGGQLDIASVMVGLEVSGGFLVAWSAFLDQALVARAGPEK